MHKNVTQRQYGLWDSPISALSMARGLGFSDLAWSDDGVLAWREMRSDQGVIMLQGLERGAPRDLNSDYSVRARVGYGGGDFTLGDGFVYFAEAESGRLYRQPIQHGQADPVTPAFGYFASPGLSPDGRWLSFVHTYEDQDSLGVVDAGGKLTSSGARRSLGATVGASRSAISFHYTGRALDLFVGSGMENRGRDPFVIAADGDRYWRVFVRAEGGEPMEIEAVTYGSRNRGRLISGRFIDLTALFKAEGFERIRARPSFFTGGTWLGAEWWHFQYENGLEKGNSTFGGELLKAYTENQVRPTPPWQFRARIFGINWF